MIVNAGPLKFNWIENWATVPDTAPSRENGRTHGVAEGSDGYVYVFHQSVPAVLVFDQHGRQIHSFGEDFPAAHGLTLVSEGGDDFLWLTDQDTGLVAKLTMAGETVQTIQKPELPIYETGNYAPTWVAVNPDNGDIWVADGYGSSTVHRYDKTGKYLLTLTGEEGAAGRFACPHAVYFDTRGGKTPELYIADRGNKRVQVYGGDGNFKRSFGEDIFVHPCAFAVYGDYLFVPELFARMAVLDGNDQLVGYIGQNEDVVNSPGWPNVSADHIHEGKFNSPHGVGMGKDGSVYVVEWIVGGRIIRLAPA